jgi:predicted ester cyclase
MSASENKEFIRRYLDAINGKPKTAAVSDLFISEQPLKDHIAVAEAAFPLYRLDPEEIIAEGDLVCVQGRIRGVHKGTFMGIPPTGKEVDFSIFITYRIAGGKIADHWMLTDNMTCMQQLGVLPVPQA